MLKKIKSIAFHYGLPLLAFCLILLITIAVSRFLSFPLDLTLLIIALLIATAWFLGRNPGLLIAVVFEITLVYFSILKEPYTVKSAFITFNRLVLFGSLVLFASSRRNAEKKLRRQRELLQVTISSIGDAVIATDADGKINFINPTAENLTGWFSAEAWGRPIEEIFKVANEETRQTVENPFSAVIREGGIVGLANHTVLISKTGGEIPIEDSGAPIKDTDGKIVGVIIVFHDVTERRRTEKERELLLKSEQAARSEAEAAGLLKDEFLATVSHELRTPLNAILGWSATLNKGKLEEQNVRNVLGIIERNAKAQAELISDILDVSRIITGKLQLHTRPLNLAPIIQTAVETFKPAMLAKSITVTFALDENAGLVTGDADRLQQIIWNLVSNAIKFTPDGGVIQIALTHVGTHIELKIIDSGIGIEEEFLPFVFERFRQFDASSTRAHGGLGLGLSIVRHLAELHGGTVSAENRDEQKGAVFTVRLPLAEEALLMEPKTGFESRINKLNESEEDPNVAANLKGVRVLVVDDDLDTLEILSFVLGAAGAEVKTADSAAAALEIFLEWKPAAIISDLGMPFEDGYQFIGKIRALSSEQGGNIPAAALTAYVRHEDRAQALAAGFQTYIPKPVDPLKVAQVVAELAGKS